MSEEDLIKKIVKGIARPAEVTAVDYAFAEDSTGIPAVWINLHVAADNHPSEQKVRKLSTFRKEVARTLLEKNVSRWPYVQLVTD